MAPAMASLIGVQCGRVQELIAHAPVEKEVLAVQKRAHEELEEAVHRNVPPVETRVLADEKTARGIHMKGRQTLGRQCRH